MDNRAGRWRVFAGNQTLNLMKNSTLGWTLLALVCVPFHGLGQWCVPTTLIPYDAAMPGITHVHLNTIDRNSAGMEHNPNNNYTNTGLSTTLAKGTAYPITINFTIDPLICPDMNLRVWIDLNHDGQLDDPGETVLSVDHQLPTTYSGTVTIPASATIGTTRMRVTAKMSNLGGHTPPTPCDQPADVAGYHGEMEDYDVNIVNSVGIDEISSPLIATDLQPNPAAGASVLSYTLTEAVSVRIDLLDGTGRQVMNIVNDAEQVSGEHRVSIVKTDGSFANGLYFVRLRAGDNTLVRRLVIDGR